jgi:Ti type entry exclusion protein TrbK
VRPSAIIIIVLIVIAACAGGAWWLLAPRTPEAAASVPTRASDFFKAPQDYKTTGGQKMKPRW